VSTIFISYASQDRETARVIAACLEAHGHSVWWDRTIPPGRVFDEVIQEALAAAQCVVVLWSSNSVRSNWVKVEAEDAAARGLLVPVLIEQVTPPIQFKRIQAANLSAWSGDETDPEFRNLLAAVQHLLGRPPTAVAPQPVLRAAPPGFVHTVRTVGWSVGVTLAVVAALWLYSRTPTTESGAAPSSSVAAPTGPSPESQSASPPPSPRPSSSAPPRSGGLISLVSPENGGELITAQDANWVNTVDGDENSFMYGGPTEAVFGFKDRRTASVEAVEVLVPGTSPYNVAELEVLSSTDSPDGPFTSIQVVKPRNVLIVKERYQRVTFTPTTARYVKVRLRKGHSDFPMQLAEWRLLGTLQ
jgi:hypothetical protein